MPDRSKTLGAILVASGRITEDDVRELRDLETISLGITAAATGRRAGVTVSGTPRGLRRTRTRPTRLRM